MVVVVRQPCGELGVIANAGGLVGQMCDCAETAACGIGKLLGRPAHAPTLRNTIDATLTACTVATDGGTTTAEIQDSSSSDK